MNKKFRIGTVILAVIVLCVVLFSGCGSGGGEKTQKKQTTVAQPKDNTQAIQDIKQAEKIFQALPSPLGGFQSAHAARFRSDARRARASSAPTAIPRAPSIGPRRAFRPAPSAG